MTHAAASSHARSSTVYRGRIFTVQVETITLPKGGELKAEIIRHPGSVVIVPVTDAGEIMLVRQYRHAIGRLGMGAAGRKPEARRRHRARGRPRMPRGDRPDSIPRAARRLVLSDARLLRRRDALLHGLRPADAGAGDEAAHQDEDEDIEAQPFALASVRAMIASGEIVDLKTVAGLSLLPVPPKPSDEGG